MTSPTPPSSKSSGFLFWCLCCYLAAAVTITSAHPFLHMRGTRNGYGRNIRPLPCVSKGGATGVCMFAWDCMKANGTHLGTCIDRFYFGSCCKMNQGTPLPPTEVPNDLFPPPLGIPTDSGEAMGDPNTDKVNEVNVGPSSEETPGMQTDGKPSTGPSTNGESGEDASNEQTSGDSGSESPGGEINGDGQTSGNNQTSGGEETVSGSLGGEMPGKGESNTTGQNLGDGSSTIGENSEMVSTTENIFGGGVLTVKPASIVIQSGGDLLTTDVLPTTTEENTALQPHITSPGVVDTSSTVVETEISTEFPGAESTPEQPDVQPTIPGFESVPPVSAPVTELPESVSVSTEATKTPIDTTATITINIEDNPTSSESPTSVTISIDTTSSDSIDNGMTTQTTIEPDFVSVTIPSSEPTETPLGPGDPNFPIITLAPVGPVIPVTVTQEADIPTFPPVSSSTEDPLLATNFPIFFPGWTTAPESTPQPSGNEPSTSESTSRPSVNISTSESTSMPSVEISTSESTSRPSVNISTSESTSRPSVNISTSESTSRPSVETSTSESTSMPSVEISTSESTSRPSVNISTSESTSRPSVNISTSESTSRPSVNISTSESTSMPSVETSTSESTSMPSVETSTSESTSMLSVETSTSESTSMPSVETSTSESTSRPSVETSTSESTSRPSVETSTSESTSMPSVETSTSESTSRPSVETSTSESTSRPSVEISTNESTSSPSVVITESPSTSTTTEKVDSSESTEEDDYVTTTTTISSVDAIEQQLLDRLNTSQYKDICGTPVYPTSRIVGGSEATFGEWPWQVSLRQWRQVTFLHKCGATLLNENWAITAAHCVENAQPEELLLRLGEFDLERADEPYKYVERKVQIVATHPQFDSRTFEYDLALLRFYEPVQFKPNIIPICVPQDDYNFINDTGFVTGWGRLYEDGPLPSVLQKVPVPVITNKECEAMYRVAGYVEHIPNIFICAGYEAGRKDSCEGDSGGPLVIQRENGRWYLAGVISWGIGCALPNQPGVYTRISEFREWIEKIIVF